LWSDQSRNSHVRKSTFKTSSATGISVIWGIVVVQNDTGAEFLSNFHWYFKDRDIPYVYIKPRTPRLNGKVERSHRIDDQEFYQLLDKDGVSNSIILYNEKLRERPAQLQINRLIVL